MPLPDGIVEVVVALVAMTLSCMVLGLLISAVITNGERGTPPLIVALISLLLLCGTLIPVHGRPVVEQLSWLIPARWAFTSYAPPRSADAATHRHCSSRLVTSGKWLSGR
ncbi:MAG TPA: ABC transporter permease [Pseudonocardia sp.]